MARIIPIHTIPSDWNADDEDQFAWDIPSQDPILTSMHVEQVLLPGDDEQPDYLMDAAVGLLVEALASGSQHAVDEAWLLVEAAA